MSNTVQNDRIILKVVGDIFIPNGHSIATYITKKFLERQCPSGHTWKHVDHETKEFYYKEFVKKYTWEPGHEGEFKNTWNLYYKTLLFKWRKSSAKPTHVPDEIWDEWKKIWDAEKWKHNSIAARNNRNAQLGGNHTGGSRSITEHAIVMEDTLQRPPDCWEVFRSTHRRKDGNFIDLRSQTIDDRMVEKVANASQATEGGELQTPSHNEINQLYYEVVGGSKKNSVYGLGSHAKVVFDMSIPRLTGGASSSAVEALRKENEDLRQKFKALEETVEERIHTAMQSFIARFMPSQPLMSPSCFPTPHGIASQETQDPNAQSQ